MPEGMEATHLFW